MKNKIFISGVVLALVVASALPAEAGSRSRDRAVAAVAGFVGGVLVANAAHGSHRVDHHYYHPAPVIRPSRPVHYERPQRVIYHQPAQPTGHYEWRTERVWVPGQWVYETLRCGSQRQVWKPGHYITQRTRVWVSYDNVVCGW